jgi:hypothetical protein
MNFEATFFAASKRLGSKSRASILDDTSSAMTMSVPSVDVVRQLSFNCGRANMMIRQPKAPRRNTKRKCRTYCFQVRGIFANAAVDDNAIVALALRCFNMYHTISGTYIKKNQRYCG